MGLTPHNISEHMLPHICCLTNAVAVLMLCMFLCCIIAWGTAPPPQHTDTEASAVSEIVHRHTFTKLQQNGAMEEQAPDCAFVYMCCGAAAQACCCCC